MCYKNFDDNITAKYGVVIDGWPLERFCNPSDIASRTEISILKSSFESGATRFRLLTQAELDTWSESRFQAALASTNDSGSPDTPNPPAPTLPNTQHSASNTSPVNGLPKQLSATGNPATTPVNGLPEQLNTDNPAPTESATGNLDPTDTDSPAPTQSIPTVQTNEGRPALTTNFVNFGVTSINGSAVPVIKKPRKERSDKGKKRGKRTTT